MDVRDACGLDGAPSGLLAPWASTSPIAPGVSLCRLLRRRPREPLRAGATRIAPARGSNSSTGGWQHASSAMRRKPEALADAAAAYPLERMGDPPGSDVPSYPSSRNGRNPLVDRFTRMAERAGNANACAIGPETPRRTIFIF